MKQFYLIAAIVGAIASYGFVFQHVGTSGWDLAAFVEDALATPAARCFAADLLISTLVFWAFMFHRRRLGHGPSPTLFVALTLAVGLGCAVPAYLYAMERGRRAQAVV